MFGLPLESDSMNSALEITIDFIFKFLIFHFKLQALVTLLHEIDYN
jgi:hypothetical protein